jgi:hypothetical protein
MKRQLLIAFILVAGVGGCSSSGTGNPGTTKDGIQVSWAEHYSTVAELKKHTDVAVHGTVTKLVETTKDAKGIPFTIYQLTVSDVIVDRKHQLSGANPTVTIKQTGGVVDGSTVQVDDDPMFAVGDEVVLFLAEGSPGLYRVIGGPNGRYVVVGGKVKPFNAETAAATEEPVASFLADLSGS